MNLKLKNDRRKSKTNASGITLIALVVTIVVLLILAGISLNLVLGSNGIIAKAKDAKNKTEQDKINTETALNTLYDEIVSAENGSGGNGGNSGGTTPHTWERKSFVATYTKDGNPNTPVGEESVSWGGSSGINLYLLNGLYYCQEQITGIKGSSCCITYYTSDPTSILKNFPFMARYCYTYCGCTCTLSESWILSYQGCDITDTSGGMKQTNFAKIPMNTSLTISEGTYVYETFESSDPTLVEGFKDGYWYKKVN